MNRTRPDILLGSSHRFSKILVDSANGFLDATQKLHDGSFLGIKMYLISNIFHSHLKIFENDADPIPQLIKLFNDSAKFAENANKNSICDNFFTLENQSTKIEDEHFAKYVSDLFSDIWQGFSDEVYFSESFDFTEQRFRKSGVNPYEFFENKIVLDAGCGSGKFSAAIAKFGAKKVIGVDIGSHGLDFARSQAAKTDYADRLEYVYGSLLDIPLDSESVDIVWSNGVIHHTTDYEMCLKEFNRVLKNKGDLFLYVNGFYGLFEFMLETLRYATFGIPNKLFQHYLHSLKVNSGRIYFMLDCCYAPYEWKSGDEVKSLLNKYGFNQIKQLKRGVKIDAIEQISIGRPYADIKYGEGQLKYLAKKIG
jgi:ubiquinone/menaquinone biosynthesis C-methylase UbiE